MADEKQPLFKDLAEAEQKYKDLQREMDKSRKREKEAVEKRMDWDELKSVSELNAQMLRTILEGSDTNEEGPVKDLVAQAKGSMSANQSRREMASALVEAGVEYSELPEDTRKLYEDGKVSEAVAAVRKGSGSEKSIEDRVAAEVQRVLREKGHVNTGDTTGPGGIPTDPKELNEKLKDKEWRKANRARLVQMAQDGRIKVG